MVVLYACGGVAYASGGCLRTGLASLVCNETNVVATPNTGPSSLTVDDLDTIGIYYAPADNSGTDAFTENLNLIGSTTISNAEGQFVVNGGAGVSMVAVGDNSTVTLNSTANIGSGVTIDSRAQYGGGVFLRDQGSGNLVVNNAGTISVVGVDSTNTPDLPAAVIGGDYEDGLNAVTALGSSTIENTGSVTAYSGRGLYAEGNDVAVELDGNENIIAVYAPPVTVSADNASTGQVEAYLAALRVINYYGLAQASNEGTAYSSERQALVAWSSAGDSLVTNSGTATAATWNAVVADTERGNATIVNSGVATAGQLDSGDNEAGYSGLRTAIDYTGNATITNTASGIVTAPYDAAIVEHTPQGNATVINAGQVTGRSGVFIDNGSGLGPIDTLNDNSATTGTAVIGTASLANSGTITAVKYGAYLDGTTNILTNSGTISASSGKAVIFGAGGPGTIVNTGTIAGGVVAQGNTAITDSGTIAGGVTGNGSGRADAIDLSGGGNRLTLQAGYQILGNVVSTSGNTNGGDTLALGGNTNGSFDLSQIVTTVPTAYTGFTQYYGFNAFIKTGTGTWTLTGASNSNATWVLDSGALTIGSNNAIGTGTLAMAAGTQLNLASNGIILGNPVTISGDPTVNVGGGNTATIGGTISDGTAPGDLVKAGAGTLVLTGNDTYSGTTTIAGGGLTVNGSIANSVVTAMAGTTLSGSGKVGGVIAQTGATLSPGSGTPGTLSVAGNYAQQAGSTYLAQVTPGAATSSWILVAGSATVANGAVLDAVKTNSAAYTLGSSYTVLTANGGLTGRYTLAGDLGLSDFYSLAAAYDANDVYLTVAQTRAFAAAADTPNQVAAANGLQSLPSGSALRNAFGLLTTDAAARTALTSLEGDIHPSIETGLLNDSAIVRGAGLDRANAALGGGQAPGQQAVCLGGQGAPPAAPGSGCTTVWLQGYGSWGSIKGDGNAASLGDDVGGLLLGVDRPILDNARIGVLAGYGNDSFSGGNTASGSANDYTIGTYGGAGWGALGLRLGATYSWSNIDTSRSVAFPGYGSALAATYQGATAQGFGELGYRIDLPRRWIAASAVEPYVGLAYVSTKTGRFTETGGAAGLSGDATNLGLGFSTLGVHGTSGFTLGRVALTATGTLGWQHAIGGVTPTEDVAFAGGSAVSVAGVPVARDAALIEAGLGTAITQSISLGLAYVGQLSGSTEIQSVRATLDYSF